MPFIFWSGFFRQMWQQNKNVLFHDLTCQMWFSDDKISFLKKNAYIKCICILPLSIRAFQDECKQILINKHSNKHNWIWKKSFFHFFLGIDLQQWRKSTSPLSLWEKKGPCISYEKNKSTKLQTFVWKVRFVTFLLVNVWLNLTRFYMTISNLACSDANNDSRFFQFWYFPKPFQIDIDIKTKKTL